MFQDSQDEMTALIRRVIAVTSVLLPYICSAAELYYSSSNTTFHRTVNDLFTHEFCGFALAPRFTRTGLQTASLPSDLKQRLRIFFDHYRQSPNQRPEDNNGEFIWRDQTKNATSDNLLNFVAIEFDMTLKRDVEAEIRSRLEEWSGVHRLMHTATYGIREYTRGAILKPHVDRFRTHILSAIINIRQETDEPWPLVAFDHDQNRHEILMDDTVDLVLYESATVIHGRPYPLIGDSYANMFVHFAPIGWDRAVGDMIQTCIDQTLMLCPEFGGKCAQPTLGHYITDGSMVIDACDHNYRRSTARAQSEDRPL